MDELLLMIGKEKGEILNNQELLANKNVCQLIWANLVMNMEVMGTVKEYVEMNSIFTRLIDFLISFYKEIGLSLNIFLSSLNMTNVNCSEAEIMEKNKHSEEALEILNAYSEFIQAFLYQIKVMKHYNSELFFKCLKLIEILDSLYSLKPGNLILNNMNSVFRPTANKILNKKILDLKLNVTDSIWYLLSYYNKAGKKFLNNNSAPKDKKIKNKQIQDHFVLRLNNIIKTSLNSLMAFYQRKDILVNEINDDVDIKPLIINSIKIFSNGSDSIQIFETLSTYKQQILTDIIFMNAITTETERQDVLDNPKEFVNYSFRVIDDSTKYLTIKTASLIALENLCLKIDGLLSYVINLVTNTITICMGVQTPEQIATPEEKEEFKNFTNSRFWEEVPIPGKIDSCIVILTRLWHSVSKRNDMLARIEIFLKATLDNLTVNCDNNVIISRMIIFFTYYFDLLFFDSSKTMEDIVSWVLNNVHREDILGYSSEDMITVLVRSEYYTYTNNEFGTQTLDCLLTKLEKIPFSNLIYLIVELVHLFEVKIGEKPELLKKLLEIFVVQIRELTKDFSMEKTTKINTYWNVLRRVSESPEIYPNNQMIIEQYISQLFDLSETLVTENNCDEDIVDCVISWISISKNVSDHSLSLIKYLEQIQKKEEGRLNKLCNLLNCYFLYAKEKFQQSDIQNILNMAFNAIKIEDHRIYRQGSSRSQGFLLMQLVLLNLKDQIDESILEALLNVFKQFYVVKYNEIKAMYKTNEFFANVEVIDQEQEHYPQNSKLYFDKMMGVFLMASYLFPEKTLKHFLQFEEANELAKEHEIIKFSNLIKMVCFGCDEFITLYDQKLLVLSFSKMIDFFYTSYCESNMKYHFEILKELISKTILILKSFQLRNRAKQESIMLCKSKNSDQDTHIGTCEQFDAIRTEMGMCRTTRQSLNFQFDQIFEDTEFDNSMLNQTNIEKTKVISMYGILTSIHHLSELDNFKMVMMKIKQNQQVFNQIKMNLSPVVASHFIQVCFQFEEVTTGVTSNYRRIVKLKKKSRNK